MNSDYRRPNNCDWVPSGPSLVGEPTCYRLQYEAPNGRTRLFHVSYNYGVRTPWQLYVHWKYSGSFKTSSAATYYGSFKTSFAAMQKALELGAAKDAAHLPRKVVP